MSSLEGRDRQYDAKYWRDQDIRFEARDGRSEGSVGGCEPAELCTKGVSVGPFGTLAYIALSGPSIRCSHHCCILHLLPSISPID